MTSAVVRLEKTQDGQIVLRIDDEAVVMTMAQWSELIAFPVQVLTVRTLASVPRDA